MIDGVFASLRKLSCLDLHERTVRVQGELVEKSALLIADLVELIRREAFCELGYSSLEDYACACSG